MEQSLACFVFGVFACVPVVGLPLAGFGLWKYHVSRLRASAEWNPAARYRRWGVFLSMLGLALHLLGAVGVGVVIAARAWG